MTQSGGLINFLREAEQGPEDPSLSAQVPPGDAERLALS
jgi:hypothetical protein